jgi:hypothetical protein
MPGEWSRSTNGVLRIVIAIVAGFSIWEFWVGFVLAWNTLAAPKEAQWFNVLSALGEGVPSLREFNQQHPEVSLLDDDVWLKFASVRCSEAPKTGSP